MSNGILVSAGASSALDAEARSDWGFNVFSLVEAAGTSCARALIEALPGFFQRRNSCLLSAGNKPGLTVIAGSGNNAADAMVMLRYWILNGFVEASASALIVNRLSPESDTGPRAELLKSLRKMRVPMFVWGENAGRDHDLLTRAEIVIDGIAGTGLKAPLYGAALEMVTAVNAPGSGRGEAPPGTPSTPAIKQGRPLVVSVDFPSGNFDEWKPGMPVVRADFTLAVEPRKYCMYTPAARPYAGTILPAGGVFPGELIARYKGIELLDWERARQRIPGVRPCSYKNERGTVEIHAGASGTAGAARIAARGAQAAGAGLVRLVLDNEIYPVLASCMAGVMAAPEGRGGINGDSGFKPDAALLGPGWGTGPERTLVFEQALALEKTGMPLVLDADAITLARDRIFGGNVILTPHPGEFARYTGIGREELLSRPAPILREFAKERNAFIVFKGHVITIAAPDGRLGVVDGMTPGLAAGGSGDLLAGFCAALAARMMKEKRGFDLYDCAAAAASLLVAAGRSGGNKNRFTDPLEIADTAADLAGEAWLGRDGVEDNFYER